MTRYRLRVANRGSAAATDVAVRLSVDGTAVDTRTIESLAAGEVRFVTFRGPGLRDRRAGRGGPGRHESRRRPSSDNAQATTCAELAP